MNDNLIPLHKLPMGKIGMVKKLDCWGSQRRRLLDLGIIKDSKIMPVLKSPSGNPIAYEIRRTVIALRNEQSKNILVQVIEEE
ncbi:MAG: FeoA family protein [Clostridia bacterium]|nr:FeoA family protein [Clostridia bacterium]